MENAKPDMYLYLDFANLENHQSDAVMEMSIHLTEDDSVLAYVDARWSDDKSMTIKLVDYVNQETPLTDLQVVTAVLCTIDKHYTEDHELYIDIFGDACDQCIPLVL